MVAIILIYLFQPLQTDIRVMMDKAYTNETAATEMLTLLEKIDEPSSIQKAYLGTLHMVMADRAYFPWSKLNHFHTGKEMIDHAYKMDEDNLEVRYLRFASQTHAPSFLGYNDYITSDKEMLISGMTDMTDHDLKKRIRKVLLASKHVTENEKLMIR